MRSSVLFLLCAAPDVILDVFGRSLSLLISGMGVSQSPKPLRVPFEGFVEVRLDFLLGFSVIFAFVFSFHRLSLPPRASSRVFSPFCVSRLLV